MCLFLLQAVGAKILTTQICLLRSANDPQVDLIVVESVLFSTKRTEYKQNVCQIECNDHLKNKTKIGCFFFLSNEQNL